MFALLLVIILGVVIGNWLSRGGGGCGCLTLALILLLLALCIH